MWKLARPPHRRRIHGHSRNPLLGAAADLVFITKTQNMFV